MNINIELYASLMPLLPPGSGRFRREIKVENGSTVQQLIDRFSISEEQAHLVLLNGHFVNPGERASQSLTAGDTVSIWPPVAGG